MGETLEMTIKKRMQNMVHFENINIIFVSEILFEISLNFVYSRPPGATVHSILYLVALRGQQSTQFCI